MKIITKHKILSAIAVFFVLVAAYILVWFGYGQRPGFTTYQPTTLPAGLKLANGALVVIRRGGWWPRFDKHINVSFNRANSWIEEQPINSALISQDKGASYTKLGQKYYLISAQNPSNPSDVDQEVIFIKGNTSIWVSLRGRPQLSAQQWSTLIDSFQSSHIDHLQTIRTSYSA